MSTSADINCHHPLWSLFFDSSSTSPASFFGVRSHNGNLLRSPRPWRGRERLEQKVSQVLFSCGPGAFSYNPFKKRPLGNNSSSNQIQDEQRTTSEPDEAQNTNSTENRRDVAQTRPRVTLSRDPIGAVRNNSNNKRRVYGLDFGRPRPFYRRRQSTSDREQRGQVRFEAKTLIEIVRSSLIQRYGLAGLHGMIMNSDVLPDTVKHQVLTLDCQEFQEVTTDVFCQTAPASPSPNRRTASFHVRHNDEPKNNEDNYYYAIFAKSQADEASGDLWRQWHPWLGSAESHRMLRILCLATDRGTQNVFFVAEAGREMLEDHLRREKDFGIDQLLEEHVRGSKLFPGNKDDSSSTMLDHLLTNEAKTLFVITSRKDIRFQNPIVSRSFRSKLKILSDEGNAEICQNVMIALDKVCQILAGQACLNS